MIMQCVGCMRRAQRTSFGFSRKHATTVLLTAAAMDALSLLELAMLQRVSSVHALDHTAAGVGGSLGGAIVVVPLALVCRVGGAVTVVIKTTRSHQAARTHSDGAKSVTSCKVTALRISVVKVNRSRLAVESGSHWAREGNGNEVKRETTRDTNVGSWNLEIKKKSLIRIRIFVDPQMKKNKIHKRGLSSAPSLGGAGGGGVGLLTGAGQGSTRSCSSTH
jgi:hypothetical protein